MIRLFKHYVPRGFLLLALAEALIFFFSVYAGKALTIISYNVELDGLSFSEALAAYSEKPLPFAEWYLPALALLFVMLSTITAMGLYERNFWDGKGDMILRVAISFVLGFLLLTLVYFLVPEWRLARREFSLGFSLAFLAVVLARLTFFQLSDREKLKRRVLVLGAGWRAFDIETMALSGNASFHVVGYIPMVGDKIVIDAYRLLGVTESMPVKTAAAVGGDILVETAEIAPPAEQAVSLFELSQRRRIDEIVIAPDDRRVGELPMDAILDCKIDGVLVSDQVSFIERETGKISLDGLVPSDMIFSDGFQQAVLKTVSKRLFDIVVSLSLLLITLPVTLLTALAVWLESGCRGPVFYLQERVGKNERVYKVIKFRSMRVDAEKDGRARWAQKNDPRITRVGGFIRRIRADELPQLVNVLLGQMSFVGPRPERPQLVAELSEQIPFYSLRHRVKPGITGWAQLCYPYGNTVEDARRKLEYDLYYIKNYSAFLDFIVLLQTAHVVLWAKGT